jgi:hypothetical protein
MRFSTVVSVLTIITIASILVSYKGNVLMFERRVAYMNLHQTFDAELFTHQEMDYITHGDTQSPLVDRRDARYLKFLRSHVTKPGKWRRKPFTSHLVCCAIILLSVMRPRTSFMAT